MERGHTNSCKRFWTYGSFIASVVVLQQMCNCLTDLEIVWAMP